MNSRTKVLRIPRTSPILFRCVQSLKKFGWKFWILILQKVEKKLALKFDKNYSEKHLSQNKVEKINAWKICSWKSSNWIKLLFIIEKNRTKLFEKLPKIFFENENGEVLTNFLENIWKTAEKWKIALHTTLYWQNAGLKFALKF